MNPKTIQAYELARGLPDEEVLELIHRLLHLVSELKQHRDDRSARTSTQTPEPPSPAPRRSLRELHGLGKGVWEKESIETYVSDLRDEWDRR